MATLSYSLLFSSHFSSNSNKCYHQIAHKNYKISSLGHPSSSSFPGKFKFLPNFSQPSGFTPFSSSSSNSNQNPPQEIAILLEVDGVLMDAYRLGNRQAFNLAFQKLGLDCANWTEPIYLDLVRKSAGDEERMLLLYFNRIGWPTSLPTSEKGTFVKNVLREKKNAMDEFVISKSSPLRPGAKDFIDDACNEGLPVVVLTAYGRSDESITRSIVDKLGSERISKIKTVGNVEVEQSWYGQLVLGKGVSSGLDEQLAKEARKAASAERQKIAEEVASMLKLSVQLDTSTPESLQKIVAALRAGAEYAGLPVSNCVLVAGSQPGVAAAEKIGMPCVVLRSSLTARAEFPSAKAVMDGFGGADLTIAKLRQKLFS
ncbi:CBBY-like protein [Euphorbia lathyris]|uniref:CBBY-like protein n=1 Tax=Euphorbia lathyris TaxID=212925 RepID=UPI003313D17E